MCAEKTCCRQSPEKCGCCETCGHTPSFCYCWPWGEMGVSRAEWGRGMQELFVTCPACDQHEETPVPVEAVE